MEHLVYPDTLQSLNAAVQGQGIALIPMHLCEDDIAAGKLESVSGQVYEYRGRYYFVSPKDTRPNQVLDNFREWLIEISISHRDN